jgi:hypothetical protein
VTELIATLEIAPPVLCSVRQPLIETGQRGSPGAVGIRSRLAYAN